MGKRTSNTEGNEAAEKKLYEAVDFLSESNYDLEDLLQMVQDRYNSGLADDEQVEFTFEPVKDAG